MPALYSECSVLAINCRLCTDVKLQLPVGAGFYSDGTDCFETDAQGKIIAKTTCTVPCDLNIVSVNSTDPTTLGGTNGTITIVYTTSHTPVSYSLNGDPFLPAPSPLVLTGLSAETLYTIILKDNNNCLVEANVTLGQSATVFDADWVMVTYQFTDGLDLDTRTRIALPDIGQNTQPQYVGWSCLNVYPTTGVPILTWGNDNTGTGFESVLVNVTRFKELYPAEPSFTLDMRAFWYNTLGFNPVIAAVTLWKGGSPIHNGCGNFCWTNPTALYTGTIDSVPKTITLAPTSGKNSSPGERVATMKYDLTTFTAILNNADVITPSV